MSTIIEQPLDGSLPPAQEASIWPTSLKWGAIGGIASSILTMLSYNLGWMDPAAGTTNPMVWVVSAVSFALYILFITLGLRAYRDGSNGGYLSLGRAVLWSLGFGLALGIVSAIFMVIFYNVLAPDFIGDMLDAQPDAMEEQGMDDEQLESVETVMSYTMNPLFMTLSSAIGSTITSVIFGVIVGFFVRSDR